MIDQDVGAAGEKFLSAWINASGGSASSPDRDMFGWDFHVELPLPPTTGLIDAGSSKVAAYFQVKSTRRAKVGESISLRNLKLAADDPAPFFFLFLQFNADGTEVVRAHLTHYGEALLSQTLGRVRASQFEGKAGWERQTISVTPTLEDELEAPFGPTLASRIRKIVGDPGKYARWKSRLRESVGYGDFRFSLEASIEAGTDEEPLELLISAALGNKARMPTKSIHLMDIRFDMPLSVRQDEGGFMELVGLGDPDWILELADGESGARVIWPVRMYSTHGLSEIADKVPRRSVWRNDFIECTVSEHDDAHKLQVKAFAALELSGNVAQLRDLATTYRILADARTLAVQFKRLRSPWPSMPASVQVPELSDAPDLRHIAQTLEAFTALAPHIECPRDYAFPIRDLLASEREIGYLADLAQGNRLWVRVTPLDFPGAEAGKRVAVAPTFCRRIGGAFLIASIPAVGDLSPSSEPGNGALQLETICQLPAAVRILPSEELEAGWRTSLQTQSLQQFQDVDTRLVFVDD